MYKVAFRTAGYIRLSREDGDKEESDSVGNQKKLLIEYISKQDDLVWCDFYIDDGYSGTNFDRPSFQRMMADIETGQINCVVVKDLSRFGRDYLDTGRYLERVFPAWDVRFIAVTDGIDSFKQSYDLLLPIKNIFNEQYARDISRKIQTAIHAKQHAGEFIGAFASYGYKKSTANKNQLVIDPYAASVVRRIFSLYIQGYGKQQIAKLLNQEGVLCPTEYKQVNGEKYQNSNRLNQTTYWSYSTINSMLHREIYVGNMVQGTRYQRMRSRQKAVEKENWVVVEGTHEPIIDRKTWEITQQLLQKRADTPSFHRNRNLFAGLLKCGDCGRSMTKYSWKRADGITMSWMNCGTYRRNGRQFCTPHAIPLHIIEKIVLHDWQAIWRETQHIQNHILKQLSTDKRRKTWDTERKRIETELERIQRRKQLAYEDYQDGLISKEELAAYRQKYLQKEDLLMKQRDTIQQQQISVPSQLLEQKEWQKLTRSIVVEMVQEILIYEYHHIKIKYRFSDEVKELFFNQYLDRNN